MDSNASDADPVLSTLPFPDDVLFLLVKYINDTDGLALAFSGSTESFPAILGKRINLKKKLSISLCSFITRTPWKSFFRQHIQPLAITTFDGSHCYWISPEELSSTVTKLINLEELIIHDTKISLAHLVNIFSACKKVVKLSISSNEKNLDQYQVSVMEKASFDVMVLGFQQLTHVKIFTLAPTDYSFHCWPVMFGVLRWCCKCIDLHLEVAYSYDTKPSSNCKYYMQMNEFERVSGSVLADLFPHLGWMSSLKSLVFMIRGNVYISYIVPKHDVWFLQTFINWLLDERRPELGRLWIPQISERDCLTYLQSLPESSTRLTSILLELECNNLELLNNNTTQQLRHLQHLGGSIYFSRLGFAPDLKYVQGFCMHNYQGLDEFCQSHPMIENLHFDVTRAHSDSTISPFSVWNLPKLKTVVYRSFHPVKGVLDHLSKFGHMIEALYLQCHYFANPMTTFEYLTAISFQHLHTLSLDDIQLGDGIYLLPIVKQCPKLERLYINCYCGKDSFLSKLGECLPLATKLRDFGLKWRMFETDLTVVDFLKNLLKSSSQLKRLVLDDQCGYDRGLSANHPPYDMGEFLFDFVLKMELLVAFCYTSFRVHPDVFKKLNRRVTAEIVPLRPPSFWFHLGPEPPKANDPSVPRIYSDEIIHPIYWFHAPPKFDWYCPPENL